MKDKAIKFVEELLKAQRSMKAERVNLNIKWGILERQKDNAIEGQYLSAQNITDMPGTPYGGYKEPKLMLINSKEYNEVSDEQSFVTARLQDLDDILCCITTSLDILSDVERQILHYYYTEGNSLEKIGQTIYMHPITVCNMKQKALEKLWESLKVLEGTVSFRSA